MLAFNNLIACVSRLHLNHHSPGDHSKKLFGLEATPKKTCCWTFLLADFYLLISDIVVVNNFGVPREMYKSASVLFTMHPQAKCTMKLFINL